MRGSYNQKKKFTFSKFKFYYHIFFTINVLALVLYSGLYVDQFVKPKFESTARWHQKICEKDKEVNSEKICTLEQYDNPLENWGLVWIFLTGVVLIGTTLHDRK